ncbi:MAG: hypothetical protein KKC18_13385 [Chloroflexi bacterium]|nr:hypothetical protein [Chloroflexota bacterium]
MENILWTTKFVLFFAIEVFVVGTLGATLIAGLYEIVRDTIQQDAAPGWSHLPTKAN